MKEPKPVLFSSVKKLSRAENLKAAFDAYGDGQKDFIMMNQWRRFRNANLNDYKVMVADEVPAQSPGRVLLVGHGFGAGKLGGLDQKHPYIHPKDTKLLSCVICGSEEMRPIMAKKLHIDIEKVVATGLPRTDAYIGKRKGDGGSGLDLEKRIYLYAPTYRTKEEEVYGSIDWWLVDDLLTDDELLLVKPHMMTDTVLHGVTYKHILEFSSQIPSTPFLIDCDILITDYSTIMFDAMLLDKTVILFEKDHEHYLKERGMYLPYPGGYSANHCRTERALVDLMRSTAVPSENERACRELVCSRCDGHAAERVIEIIRRLNNE